jgi:phosphoribosylanthranilate isomerase
MTHSVPPYFGDIKICGLSTLEAIDAMVAGGATHAGFIFFAKSPRNVTPLQAAALAAHAKAGGLKTVGVTVDATDAELADIIAIMQPDMVQLHGRETPDRAAAIKARFGLPVIKALAISQKSDLEKITAFIGIADRFLLDAKPPANAVLPGGNAVSFDWNLVRDLHGIDYLLAGGLDAGNVATAVLTANPPGLDMSSGVESAPGVKDVHKIAAFLKAARNL